MQPPVVVLISVCIKYAWVVRDRSTALAGVLMSLSDSASSECGPVPWYSFLAIQLCVLPSVVVLISGCVKTYVGRQGSEFSFGWGAPVSERFRLI